MAFETYRKNAADTLRSTPKTERQEKLNELQRTDEYWKTRVDKLKASGQRGEFSEDHTVLHWDTKNLYHGTDVRGIEKFDFAEESTVGNNAVYFTTDPTLAIGYARLRNKERKTAGTFLYEAVLKDITVMNWAEEKTVDILKRKLIDFCMRAHRDLALMDYKDFVATYGLGRHIESGIASLALDKIIGACEKEGYLNGGNTKLVAQGVMGIFFEKFVKESGFDGVITIEGGDDNELTAKPGLSVVVYNREKIVSQRPIDITQSLPPEL